MMMRLVASLLIALTVSCSPVESLPPAAARMQAALAPRVGDASQSALPPQITSARPVRAAASPNPVTETLFDFGEVFFQQYFPAGPPTAVSGAWLYRYYPATGIYLGANAGLVYVMGGPFGDSPLEVGAVPDFVASSGAVVDVRTTALSGTLTTGDFLPLRAVALDAAGKAVAGMAVHWQTSDANIAKVTTGGLALILGTGSFTITATSGSHSTSLTREAQGRAVPDGQVLVMLGPEETVFDYDTQRCETLDVPDQPAHAVRMQDGSLLLSASNSRNYLMAGPDFSSLQRRCIRALVGDQDATPQSFRNWQWISSIYRVGDILHALVHNEYHDPVAPDCKPGDTSPANRCWYNSVTYAKSIDGGRSFLTPLGTGAAVAPAPLQWDATDAAMRAQTFGYYSPSNIVAREDGYFYTTFFAHPSPYNRLGGQCVMRTNNLADTKSWRAWDGTGYNLSLANPYESAPVTACKLLSTSLRGSLTYNSYLKQYMLVDAEYDWSSGTPTCGFFYSLSADLVNWSAAKKFKDGYYPTFNGYSPCPGPDGNAGVAQYASLIDHDSNSINFETAGQAPYVYYTRFLSKDEDLRRQLVRQPIIFVKSPSFTGDLTPPKGSLDVPKPNATLSGGSALTSGWAFDDGAMDRVEILLDSVSVGTATLGFARPDIPIGIPGAPPDSGFQFRLDTTRFTNGSHVFTARAIDASGNRVDLTSTFVIAN